VRLQYPETLKKRNEVFPSNLGQQRAAGFQINPRLTNHSFGCFASRWSWPKSPPHHETTLSNSVFKQTANLKFATPKTNTESSLREALTTQARQDIFLEGRTPFRVGKMRYILSRNPVIFYHP
jgi:hypothetical protein